MRVSKKNLQTRAITLHARRGVVMLWCSYVCGICITSGCIFEIHFMLVHTYKNKMQTRGCKKFVLNKRWYVVGMGVVRSSPMSYIVVTTTQDVGRDLTTLNSYVPLLFGTNFLRPLSFASEQPSFSLVPRPYPL